MEQQRLNEDRALQTRLFDVRREEVGLDWAELERIDWQELAAMDAAVEQLMAGLVQDNYASSVETLL